MRPRFGVLLASLLPFWVSADARWVRLTDPGRFEREAPEGPTWVSPAVRSPLPFRELVVSWNLREPSDLEVEVRAEGAGASGRWWHLGRWSASGEARLRTSVPGQRDATGRVETDTLVLESPPESLRIRLRFADPSRTPAVLKRLDLSFWSPDPRSEASPKPILRPGRASPPTILEVPRRSQADHPEGVTRWCSPTSLSMLLAHWAARSGRPEWDRQVPVVAAGVHDPAWPGTGNWAFNAAYAGSVPGLQAAAVRLGGMPDLEALIDAGIPVATSVSYAMLKGGASPAEGDGHLVVVCGVTATTVTVNAPGVRLARVRRDFPLTAFRSAWEASHRTAYVVWPEGRELPASPLGTW